MAKKVTKGTYTVGVDGKEYTVKGKKVVKRGGNVEKFKAKGAKDTPIKSIKDKTVKKNGLVKKSRRRTTYR